MKGHRSCDTHSIKPGKSQHLVEVIERKGNAEALRGFVCQLLTSRANCHNLKPLRLKGRDVNSGAETNARYADPDRFSLHSPPPLVCMRATVRRGALEGMGTTRS